MFARHGAVQLDAHLLLPVNSTNPWRSMERNINILTSVCLSYISGQLLKSLEIYEMEYKKYEIREMISLANSKEKKKELCKLQKQLYMAKRFTSQNAA